MAEQEVIIIRAKLIIKSQVGPNGREKQRNKRCVPHEPCAQEMHHPGRHVHDTYDSERWRWVSDFPVLPGSHGDDVEK